MLTYLYRDHGRPVSKGGDEGEVSGTPLATGLVFDTATLTDISTKTSTLLVTGSTIVTPGISHVQSLPPDSTQSLPPDSIQSLPGTPTSITVTRSTTAAIGVSYAQSQTLHSYYTQSFPGTSTKPTATSTPNTFIALRKVPIGAIVGAALGGVALLGVVIFILYWHHRRRRGRELPGNISPLIHDERYTQPSSEKRGSCIRLACLVLSRVSRRNYFPGRLERIIAEGADGRVEHARLIKADGSVRVATSPTTSDGTSEAGGESQEQIAFLTQRIQALEAQLLDPQAPPGYSSHRASCLSNVSNAPVHPTEKTSRMLEDN